MMQHKTLQTFVLLATAFSGTFAIPLGIWSNKQLHGQRIGMNNQHCEDYQAWSNCHQSRCCAEGFVCVEQSRHYAQCLLPNFCEEEGYSQSGWSCRVLTPEKSDQHFVYTMGNQPDKNEVHVFMHRDDSSALVLLGSFETGGSGFPTDLGNPGVDVLASQHSIIRHNDWVLACNAGSNSITTFEVLPSGALRRASITRTAGVFPVSIAAHDEKVCVTSVESRGSLAGMGGTIECFRLSTAGDLVDDPLFQMDVDLLRPFGDPAHTGSFAGTAGGDSKTVNNRRIVPSRKPAQVSFTPDGEALIATVMSTGIFVYPIRNGRLTGPKILDVAQLASASVNDDTDDFRHPDGLPFAFTFQKEGDELFMHVTQIVASDGAAGGGGGIITLRVDLHAEQPLQQMPAPVPVHPSPLLSACWLERSPSAKYMWSANTQHGSESTFHGSESTFHGSVSTFRLEAHGVPTLTSNRTLLPAGPPGSTTSPRAPVEAPRGTTAMDVAVGGCGEYLYVLDAGFRRIVAFSINSDGSLDSIGEPTDSGVFPIPQGGHPSAAMGLAASSRCHQG